MSKITWCSIPSLMLALTLSGCASPLAENGKANAAGDSAVSKPSTAPEYFEMVQALADRDNRTLKKMFVTDASGNAVEAPDKTPQPLPFHFRAPTAAEVEKMGPLWPKVPPEKNAAYWFTKARMEQPDTNHAPAGSSASAKPFVGDIEALAKWGERNRPVLESAREGMRQDDYCMLCCINDETGAPQPPLNFVSGLRQIARDFTDAGFVEELKGHPERAASYYLECVLFGKKFRNASVIQSLVGAAVQGLGQAMLNGLVANAKLSDETLRRIIVACREAEVGQDTPARIFAGDSALVEAQAAMAKAPYRDDPKMLQSLNHAKAMKEFASGKPLDQLLQVHWMQAAYEKELKGLADKETEEILPRTFGELGRINARLRMTQIRAAIALYQKAEGRLPDSLDALCPDILPSVPKDPFSGKPMRYARTADGWKVWSVGAGNVDHGGEAVVNDGHGNFRDGDIVCTAPSESNIERRSHGAIKSLPAPSEKP